MFQSIATLWWVIVIGFSIISVRCVISIVSSILAWRTITKVSKEGRIGTISWKIEE